MAVGGVTQFETLIIDSIRELAREVSVNNTASSTGYARLDERLKALEKRFDESPPTSTPRKRKISAREATFGAGALVSAAIAILQALAPTHVPPPPPPRPAAAIEAPPK